MVIIGLVLFLAAAIFGIDVADKNRFGTRDIQAFGDSLGLSGGAHLYILGAITGAALVLGFVLILAGLGRKGSKARSRRRERKALVHQDSEVEGLRRQNEELRIENERHRAGSTAQEPVTDR
jgi:hypothetical protein